MRKPGMRLALAGLVVATLALGAWWYWSPYLAMRSILEAAQQRDADRFNRYVDYPRVRESLKAQVGARVGEMAGGGRGDDAGRAMAALGSLLATALAEPFIDAMVRPEVVMRAMAEARMQAPSGRGERRRPGDGQDAGRGDRPAPGPGEGRESGEGTGGDEAGPDADERGRRDVDWRVERSGVDRIVAWGGRYGTGLEERTGFVFERSGFASWRMTGILLP
jgi:hypothetical protein